MREKAAPAGATVAGLAARQHGVVSVSQLRQAGLSDQRIWRLCRAGHLHRVHRGVYAVGHPRLTNHGRWMAATLAVGPGGAVSHRSAAALWGLLPAAADDVEVTIATRAGRSRRSGILIHRPVNLPRAELTSRRGIPVTTPARTIADLDTRLAPPDLRRMIRQAEVLGLRTGLDGRGDGTRSELEHLFLDLCHRHRLPIPEVNVRLGRLTVDFLWRRWRLVAETDGYRFHRGRAGFEDDHDRDLLIRELGYAVVRVTYRQVRDEGDRVARNLRDELRARAFWR